MSPRQPISSSLWAGMFMVCTRAVPTFIGTSLTLLCICAVRSLVVLL